MNRVVRIRIPEVGVQREGEPGRWRGVWGEWAGALGAVQGAGAGRGGEGSRGRAMAVSGLRADDGGVSLGGGAGVAGGAGAGPLVAMGWSLGLSLRAEVGWMAATVGVTTAWRDVRAVAEAMRRRRPARVRRDGRPLGRADPGEPWTWAQAGRWPKPWGCGLRRALQSRAWWPIGDEAMTLVRSPSPDGGRRLAELWRPMALRLRPSGKRAPPERLRWLLARLSTTGIHGVPSPHNRTEPSIGPVQFRLRSTQGLKTWAGVEAASWLTQASALLVGYPCPAGLIPSPLPDPPKMEQSHLGRQVVHPDRQLLKLGRQVIDPNRQLLELEAIFLQTSTRPVDGGRRIGQSLGHLLEGLREPKEIFGQGSLEELPSPFRVLL